MCILLGPKEAPARVAAFAAQFQSNTSVFPLSDWEVQDPLELECIYHGQRHQGAVTLLSPEPGPISSQFGSSSASYWSDSQGKILLLGRWRLVVWLLFRLHFFK
jgi:hypothetical protein